MAKETNEAAGGNAEQPVSAETPVFASETPVPVVVTDVAPSEEPAEGEAAKAPRRKRRLRWLWWTLAGLALAGLIALSVYLVVAINMWRDYSADVTARLEEVKMTAAQDRADTEAIAARLETVQGQLDTANARITELANEEANATDSQDALRDHIEAMISCADGRQELIRVLMNSNLYFPGKSNAQVKRELDEYCESVKDDYYAYLAGDGS